MYNSCILTLSRGSGRWRVTVLRKTNFDEDADRVFFPFPLALIDDVFFLGAMLIAGQPGRLLQ